MKHDPIITADDVIRAGACSSGVIKVAARLHGKIAAAMPASLVMRMLHPGERQYVLKAAELNDGGYGDCYGDGDGDGYGNGCGRYGGYGYGYGGGYSE